MGSIPARPTALTRTFVRIAGLAPRSIQEKSKNRASNGRTVVAMATNLRKAPGMREKQPEVWEFVVEAGI